MTETQEMNSATENTGIRATAAKTAYAGDGILVVNKTEKRTSAYVVNRVKKLAGIYKAGHAGTLDPFATGVLICPVNRATRLSRFFLHGRKKYEAVLMLGTETDTLDHTGKITAEHQVPEISEKKLSRVIKQFTGRIRQVPPAYSALKHNGVPLYKYARNGNPVEKPAREVEIHSIRITRVDLPEVGFEVACSGGTYIRSLCADISKNLGCGGHLSRLVRTESCGFTLRDSESLLRLESTETPEELDSFIIPMADALRGMPACTADAGLAEKIRYGRQISEADLERNPAAAVDGNSGFIKIVDLDNRLLAVIEKNENKSGYSYCCVFQSN